MTKEPDDAAPMVDGGPVDPGVGEHGGNQRQSRRADEEIHGGPAADVAETGTALHRGERDSGLDMHDAPGTAGPGAG